jgi:inner membrane protein involved in colicin E2 resistance
MTRRIFAIFLIFVCASVAWMILGSSMFMRSDTARSSSISKVDSSWGTRQEQKPPAAHFSRTSSKLTEEVVDGKKISRWVEKIDAMNVDLDASRVKVKLDLEHRQKGLIWFSTYAVDFQGRFTFTNPSAKAERVTFTLPFPSSQAIYDDLSFKLNGETISTRTSNSNTLEADAMVAPHATVTLDVGYRSQGQDAWRYSFGGEVSQVKDFQLEMLTNFDRIDVPENALSPTTKAREGKGWKLSWNYKNLISGFEIGMPMPEKLQPGPLVSKISFFAPVSLFFFFFILFIITTLRDIDLHPMNYFFLAGAFFAFHILMAYLVDHLSVHLSFVICSLVSIFLVISYLRLVVGIRFAAVEAGIAQLVYLILFSYAFFFEGFTGLTITIGAILSLFVVMQMTGRIKWSERFAKKS